MFKKWKCPNKENVANHPDTILFTEKENMSSLGAAGGRTIHFNMEAPPAVHCELCNRSYSKNECVEISNGN